MTGRSQLLQELQFISDLLLLSLCCLVKCTLALSAPSATGALQTSPETSPAQHPHCKSNTQAWWKHASHPTWAHMSLHIPSIIPYCQAQPPEQSHDCKGALFTKGMQGAKLCASLYGSLPARNGNSLWMQPFLLHLSHECREVMCSKAHCQSLLPESSVCQG